MSRPNPLFSPVLLLLLLTGASLSPAQTAPPPPIAPAASAPPATPFTLKARANLVVLDIVVTDSHQRPVHGLTSSDFVVSEEGSAQSVSSFTEHTSLSEADAARLQPIPALPPGNFSNFAPAPVNGAVNIILLDGLNTPQRDQMYARAQLLDFLKKTPAETRIAIFGLTNHLHLLQGFTSDPAILRTVIEHRMPKGTPLLGSAAGDSAKAGSITDSIGLSGGHTDMSEILANFQSFEARQQAFQAQIRVKFTLAALNQLARYLAGIPGRKNLIWLAGSFPVSVVPDLNNATGDFFNVSSSVEEFRETIALLARSQVAVYPIDARGLLSPPLFNAAASGSRFSGPNNQREWSRDTTTYLDQADSDRAAMQDLAEQTGGRAVFGTNSLTHAVSQAIEAGANFYTLTYIPSNIKWNGAFRKIHLTLDRPGLTLAYRRGYFALDSLVASVSAPASSAGSTAPVAGPSAAIRTALMRGSPQPTQIVFKVRALPSADPLEQTPLPANKPNPDAHIFTPPFRRIVLDYAASPQNVLFSTAQAGYLMKIEFVAALFNDNGQLVNTQTDALQAVIPTASMAVVAGSGIHFHQLISVPDRGHFTLRTAVHDLTSDRVGATEIDIDSIKKLPPTAAPHPTAAPSGPGVP